LVFEGVVVKMRITILMFLSLWLGIWMSRAQAAEREATPVSAITVHPGFQVERLHSAQADEGSWISLTFDNQGRIILAEDQAGLLRLTPGASGTPSKLEKLANTQDLKHCRGVLYAHGALYVCATNSNGFYRLRDLDSDGTYEQVQLLFPLDYRSRYGHGANQITAGPDGKLYLAVGNDVSFPDPVTNSPYRNPQNDWVLPNPHDADGDGRVGFILKMNPDGTERTVVAGGLRNEVDVAINDQGELFTWDADMEWDVGLPWYRQTRINHIVSGGEYGWRWGTGKWPAWSPDSLPPNLETGLGSPTGLVFGTQSIWPDRFKTALFGADWQHGRILLIDLVPQGASYRGQISTFLEGSPLNVCDMTFGPDGALYFITGGRGSQSGLYRVTLENPTVALAEQHPVPLADEDRHAAQAARQIRHQLEELHVRQNPSALPLIWSHLGSEDDWIRFAARVALENQPVDDWRKQVATAADSPARHAALMALARSGSKADQKIVLRGLKEWEWNSAGPRELLWGLRTLELTLARQGPLDPAGTATILRKLHALPASDLFSVNWMLAELLVAMKSPQALERTLSLLEHAATQEEQIQYAKTLTRIETGWTLPQRQRMLAWLIQNRQLHGGKLMKTILQTLRSDTEESLSVDERMALAPLLAQMNAPIAENQEAVAPTRPFVRAWTLNDLEADITKLDVQGRSVEQGRAAVGAALCLRCHKFGERGGQIGPDLTAISKRFDGRTLLESILDPSKVIDPKYHNSQYALSDGRVIAGRTMAVSKERISVETDPLTGAFVSIPRADIVQSRSSEVSPMPQGLLNTLTREEILDLVAYLRRGAK
jgi:putative heme-binding domain-containing protein